MIRTASSSSAYVSGSSGCVPLCNGYFTSFELVSAIAGFATWNSSSIRYADRLRFREQVQRGTPVLLAESRELDAAERQVRVEHAVTIHPDSARLDARHEIEHLRDVVRPDARREPVLRVIRLRHEVVD